MSRFSHAARVVRLLAALLLAAGCGGPKLVPVTGRVLFKGEPLTAGSIWFHPAEGSARPDEKASCQLQLDGSFKMRTYPYGNGVPPGSYKVTLSPELANRIKRPLLADPAKTPLAIDVPREGVKGHVIEVQ